MKKKKNENYLERIYEKNSEIIWNRDEDGIVTLEIKNKGIFNTIAQRLFKKPPVSYIHLDKLGSFVWPLIDGGRDIITIGEDVRDHFENEAEPLYERLAQFFKILESYNFIKLQ